MMNDFGYETYAIEVSWNRFFASRFPGVRLLLFCRLTFRHLVAATVRIVAFLCKSLRLRFIRFPTHALGHLLLEPDLFLKERILKGKDPLHYLWIIDKQPVSNRALLKIWRKRIRSIRLPFFDLASGPFRVFSEHPEIFLDTSPYITAMNQTGRFAKIQSEWGERTPLLQLSAADWKWGYETLERKGISRSDWFACIHCRDSGYHAHQPDHDFRNGDIFTYLEAIKYIVNQGGWVLRLGDPSMPKLPTMHHVIDYAHSDFRTGRMDLFLCAACEYIVGSCSGPASLPAAFGKPMGMANCLPLSSTIFYCHNGLGLGTPKLLRSKKHDRLLSFREIMESDVGNYRWKSLYDRDELEFIDNDASDILSLAKELHAMAQGTFQLCEEDELLQSQVKSLFKEGHYCFGSEALFSPAFLKKHQQLLGFPAKQSFKLIEDLH